MFIPWPDYEDGKSKDLTKGIDKLQDEFQDTNYKYSQVYIQYGIAQ